MFIATAFATCGSGMGWSVTAATVFHELAQEISDYMVLTQPHQANLRPLHALLLNFLSGTSVLIGAFSSVTPPSTRNARLSSLRKELRRCSYEFSLPRLWPLWLLADAFKRAITIRTYFPIQLLSALSRWWRGRERLAEESQLSVIHTHPHTHRLSLTHLAMDTDPVLTPTPQARYWCCRWTSWKAR